MLLFDGGSCLPIAGLSGKLAFAFFTVVSTLSAHAANVCKFVLNGLNKGEEGP